jgi:GGDEF domain-containing protein
MIRRTNDSINRKNKASKVVISAAFGFAIGSGKDIDKLITDADANMYTEKQRQKAEKTE